MRSGPSLLLSVAVSVAVCACASGRLPSGGGATDHDAAAKTNSELAAAHEKAAREAPPCGGGIQDGYEICWMRDGSKEAHELQARRHRELSAGHTRQAERLRETEAAACSDVAPEDRYISPFQRTRDIVEVTMLDSASSRGASRIPVVRVSFAKVPGLDQAKLRSVIACHLARNEVLGNDVPGMDQCPLVPHGVRATVTSVEAGLVVTVTADASSFGEVRRRAELLAKHVAGPAEQ